MASTCHGACSGSHDFEGFPPERTRPPMKDAPVRLRRFLSFTSVLWMAPSHAAEVRADTVCDKATAREHYSRGSELVDHTTPSTPERIARAVVEFRLAEECAPHFRTLYNLGLALAALGEPSDAVEALQRFLREGGTEIDPAAREQIEKVIAEQRARTVRWASVEVQTVAGAKIRI